MVYKLSHNKPYLKFSVILPTIVFQPLSTFRFIVVLLYFLDVLFCDCKTNYFLLIIVLRFRKEIVIGMHSNRVHIG